MGSQAPQRQIKWIRVDRRYNQPFRLTAYTWRVIFKWGALLIVWAAFLGSGSPFLDVIATAALIAYALVRVRRYQRVSQAPPLGRAVMGMSTIPAASPMMRFNPPPGWPPVPDGWTPPANWQPDPSWPSAPAGWPLWVQDMAPVGERHTRSIPQDVKIQVASRDRGKCRQCGSAQELHYDHVIPWSRGGANTVNNIQLLCGPCNRRKGADDLPV